MKLKSAVLILSFMLLTACGGSSGGSSSSSASSASWYQPAVSATWQWQLQGALNTSYDVDIYDIDLFDRSATTIADLQDQVRRVICYFSAGSYENWRSDEADFLDAELGNNLDGWIGERWLDIRSENVRNIMRARLDLAQQKGCDGVEPDNVDGYTNGSGFPLTAADQLSYNRFLATAAHARGLSIGLKNDLDQVADLVDEFDFAVNEQCYQYNECDMLAPFVAQGKPVFSAEYDDRYVTNLVDRDDLCSDSRNRQFSTLILPQDLDDDFRYSCL